MHKFNLLGRRLTGDVTWPCQIFNVVLVHISSKGSHCLACAKKIGLTRHIAVYVCFCPATSWVPFQLLWLEPQADATPWNVVSFVSFLQFRTMSSMVATTKEFKHRFPGLFSSASQGPEDTVVLLTKRPKKTTRLKLANGGQSAPNAGLAHLGKPESSRVRRRAGAAGRPRTRALPSQIGIQTTQRRASAKWRCGSCNMCFPTSRKLAAHWDTHKAGAGSSADK